MINTTVRFDKLHRIIRFLRPLSTISSSFHNNTDSFVFSLHTWKLTHQPREPTLHSNPRFRISIANQIENDSSTENWDLWFEKEKQRTNSFLDDQIYPLEFPMPKRQRDSSTSIEQIRKKAHRQ